MPSPEQMRAAVGAYVEEVHRSYLAQAMTFPPGVRGQMSLIAAAQVHVAAVAARNLHILATTQALGPIRGAEVEVPGSIEDSGWTFGWTLRFYDPVVLPALGLLDETEGPAFEQVRHDLGIATVIYHFVAEPGAGLSAHHASHVGTGLANGDSAIARDFETIRSRVRGREPLVDEMAGASAAGLVRAQALLAQAIAPRDPQIAALAGDPHPDPDAVRKALLTSVGGRRQWTPGQPRTDQSSQQAAT